MMDAQVIQIARRIAELRDILELTPAAVAHAIGVPEAQYLAMEAGESDFSFTTLSRLAKLLRVDLTDLVSGESPRLGVYTLTRAGEGAKLNRRAEYNYEHLFESMAGRLCDAFVVTVEFDGRQAPEAQYAHEGQEINFMLEGEMDFYIDKDTVRLSSGDSVYFLGTHPHAMVARGGKRAVFLSVIVKEGA